MSSFFGNYGAPIIGASLTALALCICLCAYSAAEIRYLSKVHPHDDSANKNDSLEGIVPDQDHNEEWMRTAGDVRNLASVRYPRMAQRVHPHGPHLARDDSFQSVESLSEKSNRKIIKSPLTGDDSLQSAESVSRKSRGRFVLNRGDSLRSVESVSEKSSRKVVKR